MTLEELKQYYSDRLIIQYRAKPKAIAMVKLIVNSSLCDGLPQELQTCFDIDAAIGNQLTILGKIVGVPRNVYGLDLGHTFFNFTRYENSPTSIGFGRYVDNPYSNDLFYRYANSATYTLTDFELRTLIKLKIIANTKRMTMKHLKDALYDSFSGEIDIIGSALAKDISDATFFNFTRYSGTPDSVGFGRYSDNPYPTDLWYRFSYYELMITVYRAKEVYRNAMEAGYFLNILPKPMATRIVINYI